MIAVSQNGDPTGNFVLYAIDVSNDADFPPKLDCPCLGDQPLIGADANGFYVSTNAFGARYFGGAQVYAFSKSALANHASSITYALFNHLSDYLPDIEFSFSIQPSFTPPGDPGEPGTEYFVQAMRATTLEQRIAVWSLGNTAALDTDFDLVLDLAVLPSQTYAYPVPAAQKAGPTPLAERAATQDFAYAANEQLLDGNDHRMQQVMFARGKLWTAVGTALVSPGSPVRDGAAWFVVEVKNPSTGLQARIASQGYVAGPDSSHLIYPALAVNQHGRATMVFTLTGPQFYPSAAYWNFGGRSIHLLEDGVLPQDGFSAYYYARPRWGDYSAAAVGSDGSIWMATELIPPGPRKNAANWGTFVGRVGDDDHHDDD
jgi:hypothetical protein